MNITFGHDNDHLAFFKNFKMLSSCHKDIRPPLGYAFISFVYKSNILQKNLPNFKMADLSLPSEVLRDIDDGNLRNFSFGFSFA